MSVCQLTQLWGLFEQLHQHGSRTGKVLLALCRVCARGIQWRGIDLFDQNILDVIFFIFYFPRWGIMHSKTVSGVLLRLALLKPEEFLSEISHTYTNIRQ